MPSGAAKRRKSSMKKGEAHNSNNTSSGNSSSTHSHGGDDVRSIDERESDVGEFEREEEEQKVNNDGDHGSGLDREEHDSKDEQSFEVERDSSPKEEDLNLIRDGDDIAMTGSLKDDGQEEQSIVVERDQNLNSIGDGDSGSADIAKVVENGVSAASGCMGPSNGNSEEKDVNVDVQKENEKPMNSESGKDSSGEEYCSVSSEKNTEAIGTVNATVGQVHKHIPLVESTAEEACLPPKEADLAVEFESIDQDTKSNEQVSLSPNENEKFLPAVADNPSSGGKENDDKLPDSFGSLAAQSCNGAVVDMKDSAADKKSEEEVVQAVVETPPCVKNGEILRPRNEPVPVFSTSRGVHNQKYLNNSKHTDDQPLVGSTPIPVQRTSMMGCCGLFEVFSRSR